MESQQEVKAQWFPHVVLATVRISLPCTHAANRCCQLYSALPSFTLYLLLLHLRRTLNVRENMRHDSSFFFIAVFIYFGTKAGRGWVRIK